MKPLQSVSEHMNEKIKYLTKYLNDETFCS